MASSLPEPLPRELGPAGFARRAGGLVLVGLVVALLISTLPGLDELRERFAHADPLWLVALFFLEVASCLSYVVAFRGVFCIRLGWRFSYEIGMAEQGTNVLVPAGGVGGLALGAWALRQGGMSTERIARRSVAFFVLTSAPNFVCAAFFGWRWRRGAAGRGSAGPHLGAGRAGAGGDRPCRAAAAHPHQVGPDDGAGRGADRRARAGALRPPAAITVTGGVHDAAGPAAGAPAVRPVRRVGYMALDVAALAAAFTAFGTTPPFAAFVFAYVIGQLGGLIPLPGGIGGIDGGLIGALTLYGSPLSQATAAVLAYRVVQLGIPAILGSVAFVQLRRTLSREEAPAALCEPFEGSLPVFTLPRDSGYRADL